MKLNQDERYCVQIAVKCHDAPEDTLVSIMMEFVSEKVDIRFVSRQDSNYVVFELITDSESDYKRILEVLDAKQSGGVDLAANKS